MNSDSQYNLEDQFCSCNSIEIWIK